MASKRLAASTVNWTAFAERVPANQRTQFLAVKGKTDAYLRKVNAFPAEAPKIDFSAYKSKIPIPGLVDSLQKQYEAFQVPYPKENLTPLIAAEEKEQEQEVKQFISDSKERITKYEAMIAKWDKLLPYEEMTLEDYYLAHPDRAIDTVNKPTVWPHRPEDQLDTPQAMAELEEERKFIEYNKQGSILRKLIK